MDGERGVRKYHDELVTMVEGGCKMDGLTVLSKICVWRRDKMTQ